ncbi:MAG: hypothetical protein R2741_13760 [Methanolobus sp.]
MGSLTRCPECNSEFDNEIGDVQICKVCGYWTRKDTARMESVMLYE